MTTSDPVPNPRECCGTDGLLYPDGRRVCWRHTTEDDRGLLFDLDKRAAGRGLKLDRNSPFLAPLDRVWPYGPNVDVTARIRMLDWAEAHDLRLSHGNRCLHWLRTGRCAVTTCQLDPPHYRWMDHVTTWTRNGKPAVLVAQPYNLDADSFNDLAALSDLGLTVEITRNSWYGHDTTFVGVWRTVTEAMELHER